MTPASPNPPHIADPTYYQPEPPSTPKTALDRIAADVHTVKNIAVFFLVITIVCMVAGFITWISK
jgi:hypothetical protein